MLTLEDLEWGGDIVQELAVLERAKGYWFTAEYLKFSIALLDSSPPSLHPTQQKVCSRLVLGSGESLWSGFS